MQRQVDLCSRPTWSTYQDPFWKTNEQANRGRGEEGWESGVMTSGAWWFNPLGEQFYTMYKLLCLISAPEVCCRVGCKPDVRNITYVILVSLLCPFLSLLLLLWHFYNSDTYWIIQGYCCYHGMVWFSLHIFFLHSCCLCLFTLRCILVPMINTVTLGTVKMKWSKIWRMLST